MNKIIIDLHCHSTASDGILSPTEVIRRAKSNNVDILALTDHDTTLGIPQALTAAEEVGLTLIPGIELSTDFNNESIHVLGYFRDENYKNHELLEFLEDLKKKRESRANKIVKNLKDFYNIEIDINKIISESNGVVARPHIAKAILEAGYNYTWEEIFDKFIGNDSKAYVPNKKIETEDGIKLLKKFNCFVSLAHPVLIKKSSIDKFLNLGFDGMEAYYAQNFKNDTLKLIGLCRTNNLVATCGSDFHGIDPNDSKHGDIGDITMPLEDIDNFLKSYNGMFINFNPNY